MEIKKNDKFTVTIEDMGEDGAGIGRVDGYIWFVKDALIGDTIEASAMKMKKKLRLCPSCARHHPGQRPCGGEMSGGESLRRMPASGIGL